MAKALIGTWEFASLDAAPPWGTATVTFATDGKLTATFGTPECKNGFGDSFGTYRVNRDTLTTAVTVGKGARTEFKREDVLTITEIGSTELRIIYQNDKEKKEIVLRRVKSAEKQESGPGK
ncbi:MAG TPA: hypothetical protein VGE74_27635 [Gemmata sp.]